LSRATGFDPDLLYHGLDPDSFSLHYRAIRFARSGEPFSFVDPFIFEVASSKNGQLNIVRGLFEDYRLNNIELAPRLHIDESKYQGCK